MIVGLSLGTTTVDLFLDPPDDLAGNACASVHGLVYTVEGIVDTIPKRIQEVRIIKAGCFDTTSACFFHLFLPMILPNQPYADQSNTRILSK